MEKPVPPRFLPLLRGKSLAVLSPLCDPASPGFISLRSQRSLFWKLCGYFENGKNNCWVPVELHEKETFFLPAFLVG